MTQLVPEDRRRMPRIAVLGVTLLLMVLAVLPTHSAHAVAYRQFCWGVTVGGHGDCSSYNHDGIYAYMTEIDGSGYNHSVCVGAALEGVIMCSGGPNQGVYNTTPTGANGEIARIYNNAAGSNKMYGAVWLCNEVQPC
jgi:hypothetical protein